MITRQYFSFEPEGLSNNIKDLTQSGNQSLWIIDKGFVILDLFNWSFNTGFASPDTGFVSTGAGVACFDARFESFCTD